MFLNTCRTDVGKDAPKVLLLKRSMTSGNPGSWGLPGGNQDEEDGGDLYVTAVRESREEMGDVLPALRQIGAVLTKRGKHSQKHYTVFLVEAEDERVRETWSPTLNEEHSEYRWFEVATLHEMVGSLHPVVAQMVEEGPFRDIVHSSVGLTS